MAKVLEGSRYGAPVLLVLLLYFVATLLYDLSNPYAHPTQSALILLSGFAVLGIGALVVMMVFKEEREVVYR
jgi:hypothetical protein